MTMLQYSGQRVLKAIEFILHEAEAAKKIESKEAEKRKIQAADAITLQETIIDSMLSMDEEKPNFEAQIKRLIIVSPCLSKQAKKERRDWVESLQIPEHEKATIICAIYGTLDNRYHTRMNAIEDALIRHSLADGIRELESGRPRISR